MSKNKIMRMQGAIQHYAWGGFEFIPNLLNIENNKAQPFAELWMGTHPRGEARVNKDHQNMPLSELIKNNPITLLGESVIEKFGEQLPFLFKVLDVNKMLSIQAHPTKAAAEIGFKKENEAGIPLDAQHRNYKDDNHKPEIMVALSEFWLLHGFQSIEAIENILLSIPEFNPLLKHFEQKNIRQVYQAVMEMPQEEVDKILKPLKKRLTANNKLSKSNPDYWAAQAFETYPTRCDRGVFSIYFFNLVQLKKGEGIFQAAGIPHAYLEGVNMELMANSDNVFRGGLTPKHIDVPELLEHLVFEPVIPTILKGKVISKTEKTYPTPSPDFQLNQITISQNQRHESTGHPTASVLILIEGHATIESNLLLFMMQKGNIFFIPANTPFTLKGLSEQSNLFLASIPI
ncbi:MAG TPA: mannose-6-phosphate isomerase, class I [Saprospiraceae bacterium]|nr:mannose-6-phosphate isomerase, class I [Saprospiraceae bacterium]